MSSVYPVKQQRLVHQIPLIKNYSTRPAKDFALIGTFLPPFPCGTFRLIPVLPSLRTRLIPGGPEGRGVVANPGGLLRALGLPTDTSSPSVSEI